MKTSINEGNTICSNKVIEDMAGWFMNVTNSRSKINYYTKETLNSQFTLKKIIQRAFLKFDNNGETWHDITCMELWKQKETF